MMKPYQLTDVERAKLFEQEAIRVRAISKLGWSGFSLVLVYSSMLWGGMELSVALLTLGFLYIPLSMTQGTIEYFTRESAYRRSSCFISMAVLFMAILYLALAVSFAYVLLK